MLQVADALARILALVTPAGAEEVPLAEAAGRVLRADAVAQRDQPPFAASAMDGYAVRAADAVAGARLRLTGAAKAGAGGTRTVGPGEAVRIFTGAPVPEGADAILIQENANRASSPGEGETVEVVEPPTPWAFIRPAGMDFASGFRLAAPRRLNPRELALLAAMNAARVRVSRRPVVALIPTGDELVAPGETPGPGQIVSSNDIGLAAMLAAAGAAPRRCPIARDDRASLLAALEAAQGADFIVTLGGASVGEHDLVAEVLSGAGLELDVTTVAMRPGKPLMAGRIGGRVMLGLPGNPVSALVCAEVLLRPAIDAALGLPAGPRATRMAFLGHDLPANGPREHYMRAVVDLAADGLMRCEVAENQDSSLLAVLARANALAVRPAHAPAARAGSPIGYIKLD
ncbi:MAG TPA: gephyrin-like molybdotransferase Glp [Thermohalobaculum sp.]|nr:gephyrin-like molybdotransferase Glp [Thermohalobaculum sp.]